MGGSLTEEDYLVEEREELGASPRALLLPERPVLIRLFTAPTDLEEPAAWLEEILPLISALMVPLKPPFLTSFYNC